MLKWQKLLLQYSTPRSRWFISLNSSLEYICWIREMSWCFNAVCFPAAPCHNRTWGSHTHIGLGCHSF
jgi:hypothetical protein